MLPNINTCENGWSNFSENLRVMAIKWLNSHHQIHQITLILYGVEVRYEVYIFKLTTQKVYVSIYYFKILYKYLSCNKIKYNIALKSALLFFNNSVRYIYKLNAIDLFNQTSYCQFELPAEWPWPSCLFRCLRCRVLLTRLRTCYWRWLRFAGTPVFRRLTVATATSKSEQTQSAKGHQSSPGNCGPETAN